MQSIEASSLIIGGTKHLQDVQNVDWPGYTRIEIEGTQKDNFSSVVSNGTTGDIRTPDLGDWYLYSTVKGVACIAFDMFGNLWHAVSNGVMGLLTEVKSDYEYAGAALYEMAWSLPPSSRAAMIGSFGVGHRLTFRSLWVFPVAVTAAWSISYTRVYNSTMTYVFVAGDTIATVWTVGADLPKVIYKTSADGVSYLYTKTGDAYEKIKETAETVGGIVKTSSGFLILTAVSIVVIGMESNKRQKIY
jgi:hypothetical protein